jgi:arylamine N-acetyltransferase
MVILITISSEKYVVAVGNGPKNMIVPLPLVEDGVAVSGIRPEEIQLIRTGIPDNEDPDEKVWVYQWRKDAESEWKNQFCFTELEFRHEDFMILNFYTSSSPLVLFTQRVICSRMLLDETEETIVGLLFLSQSLRRSVNGVIELVKEFNSEQDRLDALREHFGIEFSASEVEAIKNTAMEIPKPLEFSWNEDSRR